MLKLFKNNLLQRGAKYLLLFALVCGALGLKAQTPGSTFYGVTVETVCWNNAGNDSTIYAAYLNAAGTTKGKLLYYFVPTLSGTAVVAVGAGTITAGACSIAVEADTCAFPDMEILAGCWDSSGVLIPVQVITEYDGDTTTINYYRRNGTLSGATAANVTLGECGPVATSLSSQLISNSLATPTVPAGTEEVVVFNYSTAIIQEIGRAHV